MIDDELIIDERHDASTSSTKTKWKDLYEVIYKEYFSENDIFDDKLIEYCKEKRNIPLGIPKVIENKIRNISP